MRDVDLDEIGLFELFPQNQANDMTVPGKVDDRPNVATRKNDTDRAPTEVGGFG